MPLVLIAGVLAMLLGGGIIARHDRFAQPRPRPPRPALIAGCTVVVLLGLAAATATLPLVLAAPR